MRKIAKADPRYLMGGTEHLIGEREERQIEDDQARERSAPGAVDRWVYAHGGTADDAADELRRIRRFGDF